jgi:hypothetical protein
VAAVVQTGCRGGLRLEDTLLFLANITDHLAPSRLRRNVHSPLIPILFLLLWVLSGHFAANFCWVVIVV